ncbi:MAG: tetratricopeptide repeat protein [Caldilineaceae bacterium]
MSHPFGDLISQHLHRKHGLSQAKLAEGILQNPSVIAKMCKGDRLHGPQARARVTAIIAWLQQQDALTTLEEANALLNAAGMAPLLERAPAEASLIRKLSTPASAQQRPVADAPPTPVRLPQTTPRHNLPAPLTPFIGRGEQIAQLAQHLPSHRLLTLTGAGGVGKTRLSIEVATQVLTNFADGVWFVDLAPLTDPAAIPQRILDLWRVPEQSAATPLTTLTTYLSAKQALIILDNCEHLIGACAALAETLLQHCPQLSLLATSREALNIGGEIPWRVPSLTRPRVVSSWEGQPAVMQPAFTHEALADFEAVSLFVERATVRQPGFALTTTNAPAVAQICSRLDGIPLALEMAAARVNVFTVEEIARRLEGAFDERFHLLTSGARTAPQRQQTLRATLEWSYGLLTAQEQWLLACLSVFSGGWSFDAAKQVTGCSLDQLAQLVNKSLVIADQQAGQTRYRLLETVRQFAAEQAMVDEPAQRQVQRQHSGYYLQLLAAQEEPLQSPQQRTALGILRTDFANISTAWQWAVGQHEFTLLASAIDAFFLFCDITGSFRTGITLFTRVAMAGALTTQPPPQSLSAQVLVRLGACEVRLTYIAQGEQHLQDALLLATADRERALALLYLGLTMTNRGDLTLAHTHLQESFAISQRCGNLAGMADTLYILTNGTSDYPEACRLCTESLSLWRQVGRPDRIISVMNFLAWNIWCVGDYSTADAYWRDGLVLCEQLDMPHEKAWVLECLGQAAWGEDDLTFAEQYLRQALAIYIEVGKQNGIGFCKAELSWVLSHRGQVEQAIALAQEAVAIQRAIHNQMHLSLSLNYLGVAFLAAGDLHAARKALAEAIQRAWKHGYLFNLMNGFYYVAELLVQESQTLDRPAALEHQALAVAALHCVRTHKATWKFFKDKAARLQAKIERMLPAEVRTAAIERGTGSTLDEMVNAVLGAVGAGSDHDQN